MTLNKKMIITMLAGSLLILNRAAAQLQYPVTKKVDTVDTYFGNKVADPYRWLEDDKSAATKEWVTAQNVVTQNYLAAISYRKNFQQAIEKSVNQWRQLRVHTIAVNFIKNL